MEANASVELSNLLLKGWAMTADSCPSCQVPLMRSPTDASLLCVNCHETVDDPTSFHVPNWPDTPSKTDNMGLFRRHSEPSGDITDGRQGDDVSQILARMMMQGYTLLSQSCPRCRTPLVSRGVDALMRCVSCQSSFLPTDSSSNKRAMDPTSDTSTPMNKMMKSATVESQTESKCTEPDDTKNWKVYTEDTLKKKILKLASEMVGETSMSHVQERVSVMNGCIDLLVKLKEFGN